MSLAQMEASNPPPTQAKAESSTAGAITDRTKVEEGSEVEEDDPLELTSLDADALFDALGAVEKVSCGYMGMGACGES